MINIIKYESSVLIALGSNMGDRSSYLQAALKLISARCGKITNCSSWLETEPLGTADQMFLNGAIICQTILSPADLLQQLWGIEKELGRVRLIKWGNRTIDCDIILWRQPDGQMLSIDTETLTIPHPEYRNRGFVLVPATEIASDWIDPVTGASLCALAAPFKK